MSRSVTDACAYMQACVRVGQLRFVFSFTPSPMMRQSWLGGVFTPHTQNAWLTGTQLTLRPVLGGGWASGMHHTQSEAAG